MNLSKLSQSGRCRFVFWCMMLWTLCCAGGLRAEEETATNEWPRSYTVDDDDVVIYPPKVEKWDQKSLVARFAVGVKGKDDSQPMYGSFVAKAETLANLDTRTVSVYNMSAEDFKFPDAGNRLERIKRDIAAIAPDKPLSLPLDDLIASLPSEETITSDTVLTETKTAAPRIVVSFTPALLVSFDGAPVFRDVGDSGLESAVNTAATVLRPDGKKAPLYLLSNVGQWLTAPDLDGPWRATDAPAGLKKIPEDNPVTLAVKNAATAREEGLDDHEGTPDVITATAPTELIQIRGKPIYSQIGTTALVRVGNTDMPLFYHLDEHAFYVLISGRWFSASELKGPWNYVSQNDLPKEFLDIPADDPSADVRASIAGTEEAEEAVVEAQVPVKAQVSLTDEPTLEVEYDGEPAFQEVPGTECAYAINTIFEVLRIGGRCYCCRDGVWFVADRPLGRWHLARVLPPALLRLPPSCPLYHTRFCVVDSCTDGFVTYSCTGGYWGTFIDPLSHVCVYGTGYFYPAYVSSSFYAGYPLTYGFGSRWRKHHGFVYEGRHVAHTTWAPLMLKRGTGGAYWSARSERWGGKWDKGRWRVPGHSSRPFLTWGKKVVAPHHEMVATVPKGPPEKKASASHVVYHSKPTERHLAGFEKSLRPDPRGEILRHNATGWEHRDVGKWVAHPADPRLEKRPRVVASREADGSGIPEARRVVIRGDKPETPRKEIEIRPAEIPHVDRKGHQVVGPSQDPGVGESPPGKGRIIPRYADPGVVGSGEIPRRGKEVYINDSPPAERGVTRRTEVGSGGEVHTVSRTGSGVESSQPRAVEQPRVETRSQPRTETRVEPRVEHHETRVEQPRVQPQPQSQPQPQPRQAAPTPAPEPKIQTRTNYSGGSGSSHSDSGSGSNSNSGSNNRRDDGRGDRKKN